MWIEVMMVISTTYLVHLCNRIVREYRICLMSITYTCSGREHGVAGGREMGDGCCGCRPRRRRGWYDQRSGSRQLF